MTQVLVQLPAQMMKELDRIAPGRSRRRSRFIRLAIQKALMDLQDLETREAYRRAPDEEPFGSDPRVWGEWKPARRRRAARKRK